MRNNKNDIVFRLMECPGVSVIMASYNYQNLIQEAIASVVAQSYPRWELVVVDDGSSDDSVEVIKSWAAKDSRIKLFTHPAGVNKGLKDTLLLGLEKVSFPYVAFLESDDLWRGDYLEKKVRVLEKYPKVGLVFNAVEQFGDLSIGREVYVRYFRQQKKMLSRLRFPAKMNSFIDTEWNFIPTFSCVLADRKVLLSCDFDSPLARVLDHWLWTQMSLKTKIYYIEDPLTRWRMHTNSLTHRREESEREIERDLFIDFHLQRMDLIPAKDHFASAIRLFLTNFRQSLRQLKMAVVKSAGKSLMGKVTPVNGCRSGK